MRVIDILSDITIYRNTDIFLLSVSPDNQFHGCLSNPWLSNQRDLAIYFATIFNTLTYQNLFIYPCVIEQHLVTIVLARTLEPSTFNKNQLMSLCRYLTQRFTAEQLTALTVLVDGPLLPETGRSFNQVFQYLPITIYVPIVPF